MTPAQAAARTAAIHAVAAELADHDELGHSARCPVWRLDAHVRDCDCWVLPRAKRIVDTVLAELARGAVS